MNLEQSLRMAAAEAPDFSTFKIVKAGMPSLNFKQVALAALCGPEQNQINTPVAGEGSLLLSYKNKSGALISLTEEDDGAVWDIPQLQGVRSSRSYRLCTGIAWPTLLGRAVLEQAQKVETQVRQVRVVHPAFIEGIDEAASDGVIENYEKLIATMGLVKSKTEMVYLRDFDHTTWV